MKVSPLLEPFSLGRALRLRNRIVMAPMTTWSGNEDGTVSDDEEDYYRLRVKDVGLVITGCTHVQKNGIGFTGEFASYDDAFMPSLVRLAAAAKSGGAPAILQIFHAGVKAPPQLVADIVAASAVALDADPSVIPRALSDAEVEEVVCAFALATRRAIEAGFDGVELHGAHAFLLQNFLSPHTNKRDDGWGGSFEKRIRFPLAVVEAVSSTISEYANVPFILGYRISVDEPHDDGLRISESLSFIEHLIDKGIDYLHVSLSDALQARPVEAPDGARVIDIISENLDGRIPLLAAGLLRTPAQAEQAIEAGISLPVIGQGFVMNPDWVDYARGKDARSITMDIAASDVARLAIPAKLWTVIKNSGDWFNVRRVA